MPTSLATDCALLKLPILTDWDDYPTGKNGSEIQHPPGRGPVVRHHWEPDPEASGRVQVHSHTEGRVNKWRGMWQQTKFNTIVHWSTRYWSLLDSQVKMFKFAGAENLGHYCTWTNWSYLRKYLFWCWNAVYCTGVWMVAFNFWFSYILYTLLLDGAKVWVQIWDFRKCSKLTFH